MPTTYSRVLRTPGAARLLGIGSLARVGTGMTPLALILASVTSGGGYSRAGLAVGAYGLAGALAGPFVGRFVDRFGARRTLAVTAVAFAASIGTVVMMFSAAPSVVPAVCVLAGATYPPLTAVLRAGWASLGTVSDAAVGTDEALVALRAPALAIDAAAFELVFVLGPVLVAVLAGLASPGVALLVVAGVTVAGTAAVLPNPLLAGPTGVRQAGALPARRSRWGALAVPGLLAVIGVSGALGVAFGAVTVAVTAFAGARSGSDLLPGFLLGAWGAGSVLGGLLYAARSPSGRLTGRLGALLAAVAVSLVALAAAPGVAGVAVVLVIGGAAIAPTLAVYTLLANQLIPAGSSGEANNWLVSVPVAAQALGGWAAGLVVDGSGGPAVAFTAAGLIVFLSLSWVWWPGRGLRRAEAVSQPAGPSVAR